MKAPRFSLQSSRFSPGKERSFTPGVWALRPHPIRYVQGGYRGVWIAERKNFAAQYRARIEWFVGGTPKRDHATLRSPDYANFGVPVSG